MLRRFCRICRRFRARPWVARFAGLPEVERRLGLANRLAACRKDPRALDKVVHSLAEIIRFRILIIAAGYEDSNDADTLRRDPMFKLALDRSPSGEELCSRVDDLAVENLPDVRALLRLGPVRWGSTAPRSGKRIVLDIDGTFRPRARQRLLLFSAANRCL
jgi:hypothetical protein